jgi:hypothetical protein
VEVDSPGVEDGGGGVERIAAQPDDVGPGTGAQHADLGVVPAVLDEPLHLVLDVPEHRVRAQGDRVQDLEIAVASPAMSARAGRTFFTIAPARASSCSMPVGWRRIGFVRTRKVPATLMAHRFSASSSAPRSIDGRRWRRPARHRGGRGRAPRRSGRTASPRP